MCRYTHLLGRLGFLIRARQRTGSKRVALRQEQAAEVGGERREAAVDREEWHSSLDEDTQYGALEFFLHDAL